MVGTVDAGPDSPLPAPARAIQAEGRRHVGPGPRRPDVRAARPPPRISSARRLKDRLASVKPFPVAAKARASTSSCDSPRPRRARAPTSSE